MTTTSLIASSISAGIDIWTTTPFYHGLHGKFDGRLATEADAQEITELACTVQNLGLRTILNTYTSQAATYLSRKNGATGNLTITVNGAGTGWLTDATHSDSLTAGDKYNAEFNGTSSAPDFTITIITCALTSASGKMNAYGQGNSNLFTTVNTTKSYGAFFGGGAFTTTTEGNANQFYSRSAGTISGLYANYHQFTGSPCTHKTRIGGVDGNQSISCTALGITVDSTHSDTIAATNLINTSYIDASVNAEFYRNGVVLAGSNTKFDMAASSSAPWAPSVSTTYYMPFSGYLDDAGTTEINNEHVLPTSFTLSNLRMCNVAFSGATATLTSRKNAGAGNQTVTPAGTGWTEDVTHTDSYSASDNLNWKYAVSAGGSQTVSFVAATLDGGGGVSTETGTAIMSFAGISFVGAGTDARSGAANMAFKGIAFNGAGAASHTGVAIMSFAGVAFVASGFEIPAPGKGLRQFWAG